MRHLVATALVILLAGCTSPREYVRNGYKVGPNYCRPGAPVAGDWIDAGDKRVRTQYDDLSGWWTAFNDPLLDSLVQQAYRQNLTLRQAGFRILAARAQLGFAVGELFPQTQTATGFYRRLGIGQTFSDQWNVGFNMSWELDFWGRFRRSITAAQANLDASVADYDDATVTLLADIASNYIRYRTDEVRIRLLEGVIPVQRDAVEFITKRLEAGAVTDLDRAQIESTLRQSEAALRLLEIDKRLAQNSLCILLGMPVTDMTNLLASRGEPRIPTTPEFVVAGVPADLLRRRPDVRRAERQAAAQAEQIGIAAADFYPAISISGTLGWQASSFSNLFSPQANNSNVGPGFRWNLLNYGRIRNNVLFQDALFQQLVAAYQGTVLQADLEVENGIVTFLQSQERAKQLAESVKASRVAAQVIVAQNQAQISMAKADFNRFAVIIQTLITQQDQWAQARSQVALSLIETYRALGGGWQIRLGGVPDKRGYLSDDPGLVQPEAIASPDILPLPGGEESAADDEEIESDDDLPAIPAPRDVERLPSPDPQSPRRPGE